MSKTMTMSTMNNEIFDYENFKSNSNILFSKKSSTLTRAINFFNNNIHICDGIAVKLCEKFPKFNSTLNIDNNGFYYYEHKPNIDVDIIDTVILTNPNPNPNVTLTFYIGDVCYDQNEFTEFINITKHNDFKFRLTFSQIPTIDDVPTIDDSYTIYYYAYILKPIIKQEMRSKMVITKSNIYDNGTCRKINTHHVYKNYYKDYV